MLVLKYIGHDSIIELIVAFIVTLILSILVKYLIEDYGVKLRRNIINKSNIFWYKLSI